MKRGPQNYFHIIKQAQDEVSLLPHFCYQIIGRNIKVTPISKRWVPRRGGDFKRDREVW